MRLTVSASILALYDVLGFPSVDVPNPMSQEMSNTKYSHLRKTVGYHINTRCLVVGILPQTRTNASHNHLLECYFTLKEVSSLHGTLESLSRNNRWGRAWFFALQNAIRAELIQRYHILKR
jgi:aminopeptidase C